MRKADDAMNSGRAKVEAEGACRVCHAPAAVCDAAHLWPRSLGSKGFDEPDLIVPLCAAIKGADRDCHGRFDAHELDLLARLTLDEQVALVRAAGSIERARDRAIGRAAAKRADDLGPFAS